MSFIHIEGLKKNFGKLEVLKGIDFSVEKGDVIAVIGSSGSGKSTLLRCLIGLETVDGGSFTIDDIKVIENGKYAHMHTLKEITGKMGMVFQNFNLFPHMSVRKNLTMPYLLKTKDYQAGADKLAAEILNKVGVLDKIDEMPKNLSGGQQQRVAIARAMMLNPEIMLFDEPTSALDPQLTGEVLSVMKQLASEHMTMLVVTHEMSFARNVATKVVYMSDGRIVEEGSPEEIFTAPKHEKTREFLKGYVE